MVQTDKYKVIGIMSGTSLDGLDVALCTFELKNEKWAHTIERAITFPYTQDWKDKLAGAEHLSGLDLTILHNELGSFIGHQVNQFLEGSTAEIDFIASHGHTIFHQPHKGLTLQIGNGACISATTGLSTICDFRTMDVALGGQGAPLVPIGDKLLFADYDYCLNLGGFANISHDNADGIRVAYDICPINIVINHLVKERNLSFDSNGEIAQKGEVDTKLLTELNNLGFYKASGPKSLGKEWVLNEVLPIIYRYNIGLEDKLRTFYEHIVFQINNCLKSTSNQKLLITGGGAHNLFLIELFKRKFNCEICKPNNLIIDFKEALIFAFLGVLRFRGEVNCLSSVTGAKCNNVGGVIYLSNR